MKIRLFGANGQRDIQIVPPTAPAPITPKPQPVLPAFQDAWAANRQRVIGFLADGFGGDLSNGSALHELGDAITAEYAPRKKMTADQWRALTADLLQDTWETGHWLHTLKKHIHQKYEGLRIARKNPYRRILEITDDRILTVMQAITDTYDDEWQILCSILKVATQAFSIAADHESLLACLRSLYQRGKVEHKRDAYKQHLFRLISEKEKSDDV